MREDFSRYADRAQAGRVLARDLGHYAERPDVLVLGLPRGGVPVAAEISKALNVPFDILVVRKLGAPGQEELAMGAIAGGGVRVINQDVVRMMGLSEDDLERAVQSELHELERREGAYRGSHAPPMIHGRTVILADDGLATGSTMRAAIKAVRAQGAAHIVVAIPVGAPRSCADLAALVDEVVCPHQPPNMGAISMWYEDFPQTPDQEVKALLAERPHYGHDRHSKA